MSTAPTWPDEVYELLRASGVTVFGYVPDAGHTALIERSLADPGVGNCVNLFSLLTLGRFPFLRAP